MIQEGRGFYFSRHTRNKVRLHHISEAEKRAVLAEPDTMLPGIEGRTNALKQIGDRVIE